MHTLMIKKKKTHKKQKTRCNRTFPHHIAAASTPMKGRFSVLPEKNIITNYIIFLGSCLYQGLLRHFNLLPQSMIYLKILFSAMNITSLCENYQFIFPCTKYLAKKQSPYVL